MGDFWGTFLFGGFKNFLYICTTNQQNSNIMAKFYLRTSKTDGESTLYIDVNRPKYGVKWKVNTGIKVSISKWIKAQSSADALRKYLSTEEGRSVNAKTDECERIIKDYFDNDPADANKETLEKKIKEYQNIDLKEKKDKLEEQERHSQGEVLAYYESFFAGIQEGSIRHGDNKRYSASAISAWRTFGEHLKGFLIKVHMEHLHFDNITKRTAISFVTYCEQEELMKGTIGQQINHFRKLCNGAAEDGVNSNAVSLRIWKSHDQKDFEKRAEIALTDGEIDALYNLNLSGHVEQCRDLWMLGYFSAQRVSDYSKFGRDNFGVNPNGTPVIRIHQQKTDNELEVPIIDDRVFEICDKYNYQFPPLKRDAINRGIKAACKVLSESVTTLKEWEVTLLSSKERDKERWFMDMRQRVESGEKLHGEESKRYKRCLDYAAEHESGDYLYRRDYNGKVIRQRWELVSCHTSRRSMVTNLHRTGLYSDREIMEGFTGHKTLNSYENYMKIKKEERATSIYEKTKKAKEVKLKKEA